MTVRDHIKTTLLFGLIAVSLGGLLLHLRIHPASQNSSNLLPVITGILSVIAVPMLYTRKNTISYGYALNGFLVIIGTVAMSHFALAHWPDPPTYTNILLKTTFPDIVVLWTKFFLGKALFELEMFGYEANGKMGGKSYRYPNTGWWMIHLAGVSAVYAFGHLVWR